MDKAIDRRFERLEKALSSLIESVTKYHPSVAQSDELRAADSDLNDGLEQVQLHQDNHIRIQQLRQNSAALDAQIRDTLTSLATARKDIATTPTTKLPVAPSYLIVYDELLSYARRISKTTLPPASMIVINGGSPSSEMHTPMPDRQSQSATTPSVRSPSHSQSSVAINGTLQPAADLLQPQQPPPPSSMNTSLPEGMSLYLNPLFGQAFFPWPLEDRIRSGSLASNQMLAEQGIDPRGYDPATEEKRKRKEEEGRKIREEREKIEREERERQIREERERLRVEREKQREKEQEAWRRASIAGQPDTALPARATPVGEKKQFQFTNLDDLDDEDEDDDN